MIPFIILSCIAISTLNKFTSKTCSNIVSAKNNKLKYILYLTLMGFFACCVFFILNGFKIFCTPKTLYFALAFSGVCAGSVICTVNMFKFTNIASVVVLSGFGSMVAKCLIGFLVFNESLSVRTLLKIAIMTIPTVLTFLEIRRNDSSSPKTKKDRADIKLAFIVLFLILLSCFSTVIIKTYSNATDVADMNSMFFLTNVFMTLGALLVFSLSYLGMRGNAENAVQIKEALSIFHLLPILITAANTAASNISTLLDAKLLSMMDVSVYTPVSSAIGILAGVIASFIYRERHEATFYISAALALIAVII